MRFRGNARGTAAAVHPTLAAAARGTVAAMAMTGVRRITVGLGIVDHTPPEDIVEEGAPQLVARVGPRRRDAVVELVHWGVGAAGGVVYAALPRAVRESRVGPPLYGLAMLGVFETVVQPALGMSPGRLTARQRLALGVDHVLYGLVLGGRFPPRD